MKTVLSFLLPLALLGGCAQKGLEIRQVGSAHTDESDGTTKGRVAIGIGQLNMGNVALALETFRRAARDDPSSAEALAGMAECYQRMGRTALSRRYLEQALALTPQEPGLYRALAIVSESEGKAEEGRALRAEADLRAAGKSAAVQRVTVDLPAPTPAPRPEPRASAPTLTLDLPPARPASATAGPRLVRLSIGEVQLVTTGASPFGHGQLVSNDVIHAPLRILNAARIQGVAARTRTLLAAKGIRDIRIGNAPGRRPVSAIHFAAAERARALAIAARLPYRVQMVERAGPMVLLVGRDAGTGA